MNIKEARINATLDKKVSIEGKLLTRREFMHWLKARGCASQVLRERQYDKEEKERNDIERIARGWSILTGNTSHPLTIAFNARKAALAEGIYKISYFIGDIDDTGYIVTKTEYDYFNSL